MSDDWQVVEEALRHGDSRLPPREALYRLREREAQLRADSADTYARERAAEARVAELEREAELWIEQEARINEYDARVARLEEALRKIENGGWGAIAQHVHYDVCEFARRALAHEEER